MAVTPRGGVQGVPTVLDLQGSPPWSPRVILCFLTCEMGTATPVRVLISLSTDSQAWLSGWASTHEPEDHSSMTSQDTCPVVGTIPNGGHAEGDQSGQEVTMEAETSWLSSWEAGAQDSVNVTSLPHCPEGQRWVQGGKGTAQGWEHQGPVPHFREPRAQSGATCLGSPNNELELEIRTPSPPLGSCSPWGHRAPCNNVVCYP